MGAENKDLVVTNCKNDNDYSNLFMLINHYFSKITCSILDQTIVLKFDAWPMVVKSKPWDKTQ